jgi:hypothetical protein
MILMMKDLSCLLTRRSNENQVFQLLLVLLIYLLLLLLLCRHMVQALGILMTEGVDVGKMSKQQDRKRHGKGREGRLLLGPVA